MFLLQVHAFSVCDDPDYFYDFVQGLLDGLEAGVLSRDIVDIHNVSVQLFCRFCNVYNVKRNAFYLCLYETDEIFFQQSKGI